MSALPLLAMFIKDLKPTTEQMRLVIESMLKGIWLCELLQNCLSTAIVSPSQLEEAILGHLHAQFEAYADELGIPKTHYATHLGDMLRRFKLLIGTYTQERLHQLVKQFVNSRHEPSHIEKGVLEDLTLDHIKTLSLIHI